MKKYIIYNTSIIVNSKLNIFLFLNKAMNKYAK